MDREKDIEGIEDFRTLKPWEKEGEVITEETELVEGMMVQREDTEPMSITWIDRHRDNSVVAYDSYGHSNFLTDIYNGKYYAIKRGFIKYRVVYGEAVNYKLSVTDGYYKDLEEFRRICKHKGFAKALGITGKMFYKED